MLKLFYVGFRTVVGKLLMAGTLISTVSCAAFQPDTPYYGSQTKLSYSRNPDVVHTIARLLNRRADAYSVPAEDRQRHERCVFFALEKLNLGEECRWYSNTSSTSGVVKIVSVYPSGHRMCHVFFTHLQVNRETKNWQDTACYSSNTDDWTFIAKR